MAIDLVPASGLSTAELTELFNASYEGYVIPFVLDEAVVRRMIETFDIDLEASRVAVRDGEPVGLANLALRGEEAWIGGLGVVSAERQHGLGAQLMEAVHEEARRRGAARVWLEVIHENEAAFRLYERLGYEVVRGLAVWTLAADGDAAAARDVPVADAHTTIREARVAREPWQRADGTLAHYDDLLGLVTDGGGAAVYRMAAPGIVQLMQLAGDDVTGSLEALRGRGQVRLLNLAEDDPAGDALRALGGTVTVRQHEMALPL